MTAQQLRMLVIAMTAIAAGLSFVLGGAQQIGMDPFVSLLLGAVLAALNVAIGAAPSFSGQSGVQPGKTEKEVARESYTAGQRGGSIPRGLA